MYAPVDTGAGTKVLGDTSSREEILDTLSMDDEDEKETIDLEKKDKSHGKEKDKEDKESNRRDSLSDDKGKVRKEEGEEETDEEKDKKDKEEIDELTEIEKELQEDDEEIDDDKLEYTSMPRRKEILAKFPKLFEEFPQIESAIYREQQFTEMFPTMADAKVAIEKVETLDSFEKDLKDGNIETILKSVKEEAPNSFNKVVDNYLGTLYKIDPSANQHVIGRIIQDTILAMINEGNTSENEVLKSAATILHQFVFGSSKFKAIEPLHDPKAVKETAQPDEAELKFVQRRFENSRDDLETKVEGLLKTTIDKYIDPRTSMTPFVKKHATNEAIESLTNLIDKDTRFRRILDKLWERAFEADFDTESLGKIRQAYIAKAKTLLPSVIKKARQDALKGVGSQSRRSKEDIDDNDDDTKEESTSPKNRVDSPPRKREHVDSKKDGRGMSTYDFFSAD